MATLDFRNTGCILHTGGWITSISLLDHIINIFKNY